MKGPVRTCLFGLADPVQAHEIGLIGIDAVIVVIGDEHPAGVAPSRATEIAAALPPLTIKLAFSTHFDGLPRGFSGTVADPGCERPSLSTAHVVRIRDSETGSDRIGVAGVDAVWVEPGAAGTSSTTRFDFTRLARLAIHYRTILEIPDGAAGVETAIRLGHPYGILFGEGIWFRPGIIDLDRLETASTVCARLNKALAGQALDA